MNLNRYIYSSVSLSSSVFFIFSYSSTAKLSSFLEFAFKFEFATPVFTVCLGRNCVYLLLYFKI